ncbi:protein of unknown function [Salinihabitans flavidus]|uniref:GH25 family protein n=1 Tax=Salinihabitans flavidus TaxID=569882 RepID=A0A1H8NKT0_9RHOB|nr:DUF4198 domain-containing protein [Salinihabitans flavidus]SEO30224.1 protein of unknown function [Salinihabitans flavidus]
MIRPTLFALAFSAALVIAAQGRSHEFWIDPAQYQVETGQQITARLRNGEGFSGAALAWLDHRIARFDWYSGDDPRPVAGRLGDNPAVRLTPDTPGLLRLVHETTLSKVTYRDWETPLAFARHKDLGDLRARHAARGLDDPPFTEGYRRFVKALIGVGDSRGQDGPTGMETEFVALANPYTDTLNGELPVRLLYRDAPRANAQVEVFECAPDGTIRIFTVRTDDDGIARVPVRPGHVYLLDAVILRAPAPELADETGIVWETLWAALTFAVPG